MILQNLKVAVETRITSPGLNPNDMVKVEEVSDHGLGAEETVGRIGGAHS